MYDELLLLVAKNHHQEVLQRLLEELTPMINKSHGNNKEYAQRIVMLYSNYTELETKRKLNNQSPQEMRIELNQLKSTLIELILDLKSGELNNIGEKLDSLQSFPPKQLHNTSKQHQDIAEWLYKNRVKTATAILKELQLQFKLDKETNRKLTNEFVNAIILFSGVIGNNHLEMLDDPAFVFKFQSLYKELYSKGLDNLLTQLPQSPRISSNSRTSIVGMIEYFKSQLSTKDL